MSKLLRAPLLLSALFLVLFFGAGIPGAKADHTQNVPTVDIRAFLSAGKLDKFGEDCKTGPGYRYLARAAWCNATYETVDVFCRREVVNLQGDFICTFTATDGSKVVADPNIARGSETRLYDSEGHQLGRTNTDGFGDDSGGGELDGTEGLAASGTSNECGLDNIGQCFLNLPGLLFSALAFLLLTLSSMILGIAGVIFNWVVIRTVFQFALYFGTSEGMIVAWGVLRDIANIALLFGFIFMGIATILNTKSVEGYTAKKALPSLIIFAVLLNFSLFATQGIIDVSNGFSSVFASYAGESCETTTSGAGVSGQSNADCANLGISSKILEAAGMHQIIPSGDQAMSALRTAADQPYTYAVMLIVLSIMVTVTAMVLIAASIMLIIRVVVLSLLMVTSPIGFAGMAIPALHKIAKDWWHKLINQAFFAPIFLLMVFVSLKLVDTLQDGQATMYDAMLGNTANAGATTAGNMQVVVVFMIVIGFMIAALVVAQKMGAYGASFATKSAAGLSFGVHGFVARRTVGRLSGGLMKSKRLQSWAQNNPGAGRLVLSTLDKGSKASFSTRNTVGGALKGAAGLDFGAANKTAAGGYAGIKDKVEKEHLEHSKRLITTRKDDQDIKDSEQEAAALQAEIRSENTRQEATQENFKREEDAQKAKDAVPLNIARADLKLKADEVKKVRATGTAEEQKLVEEQYNNDLRAFDNMQKEAEERLAVIRSAAAANKREHDELVGSLKLRETAHTDNVKFTEKDPQRRYGKELKTGGLPTPFVDAVARKSASAKILKDIDKDGNARMQDTLDAINKKTKSS